MKNDLTCEVVQDLLPSYVDGLTIDVSNQAVEQHMKTCESCRKLYSEMREPMNGEDVSEINDGQKADSQKSSEIDYLKKYSKEKPDADFGSSANRCDRGWCGTLEQSICRWTGGRTGRVRAGKCGS